MSLLLPEHVKKKLDLLKDDLEHVSCFRKEKHGKNNVVIEAVTSLFVYSISMTVIIHLLFAKGVDYIAGVKEEPPDLEDLLSTLFARTGIGVVLTKELCQGHVLMKLVLYLGFLSKALKESYYDAEPHLKLRNNIAQSSIPRGKQVTLFFEDSNLLLFVSGKTDLRSNLFQEGGDDMTMDELGNNMAKDVLEHDGPKDQSIGKQLVPEESVEAMHIPLGPLTRSKSKLLKETVRTLLIQFEGHLEAKGYQTTMVSIQAA